MSFSKKISSIIQAGLKRKYQREIAVGEKHSSTIISHIQALRHHAVRACFWFILCSALTCLFMRPILNFLKKPYEQFNHEAHQGQLTALSIFEVMTVNIKVCFFLGFALSLPAILGEIWKFVSPALYPDEKKWGIVLVISSVFLFYIGISFSYFLIVPYFFQNALSWASSYAFVMISYENYFQTLTTMILIFAAVFEIPVILSLLGLVGILPAKVLINNRKIIFLLCFIIGAVLAPPDVFSLCLVAIPMYIMIEISILILKKIETK